MSARYTVVEPLGGGRRGFRATRATDDGRVRDVAITLIAGLIRPAKFWPMLRADIRPAVGLVHPNILELVDVCATPEGELFVVAEHVKGCPLKAIVRRGERIPISAALYVVTECCKALGHAHPHVIHREVSPRSLLVSTTGEVKLIDFGLAKVNSMIEDTDPGVVKGMFGYLSPEQALGTAVDHRTDVFAAGIVLWELLAGHRLFDGDTDYQTVELVRAAVIPPIAGLDPTLTAILRCALARDPAARFSTAAHLGEALSHFALAHDIMLGPVPIARLASDVTFELDREFLPYPGSLERMHADAARMVSILDPS